MSNEIISQLTVKRDAFGAHTPRGRICSNVIEQLQELRTYIRPAWATDENQTLPYTSQFCFWRRGRFAECSVFKCLGINEVGYG